MPPDSNDDDGRGTPTGAFSASPSISTPADTPSSTPHIGGMGFSAFSLRGASGGPESSIFDPEGQYAAGPLTASPRPLVSSLTGTPINTPLMRTTNLPTGSPRTDATNLPAVASPQTRSGNFPAASPRARVLEDLDLLSPPAALQTPRASTAAERPTVSAPASPSLSHLQLSRAALRHEEGRSMDILPPRLVRGAWVRNPPQHLESDIPDHPTTATERLLGPAQHPISRRRQVQFSSVEESNGESDEGGQG
ncbi:hypothetical protein AURDEDRAFT_163879 [Auricularia subglabra TFB-10046 SS5]|nr:hypothetical protein AURDEDRAFT_163879 [Auricularia subglabra TFB-10046 SS5]